MSLVRPALPLPLAVGFNLGYWQVEKARPCLVRCKWCCLSSSLSLSHSHIKSGSRQSDRLPQEMTPVTEGSTANLQASFCLNSLSPCRQLLSHCQLHSPLLLCSLCFAQSLHNIPPPSPHKARSSTRTMFPDMSLPTYIYLLNEYCTFLCYFGFINRYVISTFLTKSKTSKALAAK